MDSHHRAGPTPSASVIQAKFAASACSGWKIAPAVPLKPGWLFLYGTLMDAEVLQSILSLSEPPQLRNATVRGFRISTAAPQSLSDSNYDILNALVLLSQFNLRHRSNVICAKIPYK